MKEFLRRHFVPIVSDFWISFCELDLSWMKFVIYNILKMEPCSNNLDVIALMSYH